MSICFRTLPCKLTSLVGQWNQIVQLDRRLTRLISTSTFLQENNKTLSKVIVADELSLTSPTYKKSSIDLNNLGIRLYSTAPKLSEKPIGTSAEHKYSDGRSNENDDKRDKPSEEQLTHIVKTLEKDLPRFFVASMDFRIYRLDVEFINNFKGVTTKGLNGYIKQVLSLRVGGHVVYAYIKFDVLKITTHPEENAVKVRWRIRGLSTFKVFFNFWKLRVFDISKSMQDLETWYDGFSTYYVDADGKVYRHVADKMMPDDDKEQIKAKSNIAAKLAA